MSRRRWACSLAAVLLGAAVLIAGCLDFGRDYETIHPSTKQVTACRSMMFLNPSIRVQPLGLKVSGSGIDKAVWFKFKTDAGSIRNIFDRSHVDTARFGPYKAAEQKDLSWWCSNGRRLLGGQVALPDAKAMDVWIEPIKGGGYIVYVFWFET